MIYGRNYLNISNNKKQITKTRLSKSRSSKMTKSCIILGSNSDIAKGITPMLQADGWEVHGEPRGVPFVEWDLIVSCIGTVAPVGLWHSTGLDTWRRGLHINLIEPFQLLWVLWNYRKPNATVCFMAGSNPQMIMNGYSAYNTGKMGLLKLVEQLDEETPDVKFFALGPGTILTKIHRATTDAHWPNPKLQAALEKDDHDIVYYKKIQKVYDTLMWCVSRSKAVVGGRNICVSDLDKYPPQTLAHILEHNKDMFKLRRWE